MRTFLIAATALAIAAPAAAQQQMPNPPQTGVVPIPPPDPRDEEIRRSLPDPREMQAMGDVLTRTMDAVMDVPIGPLREAIEGRKLSPREHRETIGDHARRDDPYFRERMRDQVGVATVALGALAEQMTVMAPVLRQTLEDVERRVEDAARGVPAPSYPPR